MPENEKLNQHLYEKMSADQDKYRDWLTSQPPEEILNHAYEYSVREDILMAVEDMSLPADKVQALLSSNAPLDEIYNDFSQIEGDHMDIIRGCIETRANDLIEEKYRDEAALRTPLGFVEAHRTDAGINFTIYDINFKAVDNGVMENSRISAYEAAEKVWLDNGLSNIMIADREELLQKVQEVENGGKNLDDLEQETPAIPPVYVETGAYAREHGELDSYRESAKLNRECAHAIGDYIRDNYRDNKLDDGGIKDVIDKFGAERVQTVLANTIQQADWDGRYSRDNKAWANTFPALPDNVFERVTGHPCLVDGLTDMVRRHLREAEKTVEKPSIRDQLKTIAKELEPKKQPAKKKEQGVEL